MSAAPGATLHELTAGEAAAAIREKRCSPVDLVEALLARITTPPVTCIEITIEEIEPMARATFFVDDPMGRNTVQVLSRAPLETILVRSTQITGQIEVDTDSVVDRPSVTFTVPVDSLDTGIPLMNEVMRSDRWLDAGKFPTIQFTLARVTSPAGPAVLKDRAPLAVEGEGTLELHGASKPVRVRAEVTWLPAGENTARRLPGDIVHVVVRFDVHLPAFGIEAHLAPQSLDKVAGTLGIEADLFASTQRPQIPETMLQNLARARKDLGQRLLAQGGGS